MGKHQHRRALSVRPRTYLMLNKLGHLRRKSSTATLEDLILSAATAAGIEVTPAEVEELNAARTAKSRPMTVLDREKQEHDAWLESRKLQDAF